MRYFFQQQYFLSKKIIAIEIKYWFDTYQVSKRKQSSFNFPDPSNPMILGTKIGPTEDFSKFEKFPKYQKIGDDSQTNHNCTPPLNNSFDKNSSSYLSDILKDDTLRFGTGLDIFRKKLVDTPFNVIRPSDLTNIVTNPVKTYSKNDEASCMSIFWLKKKRALNLKCDQYHRSNRKDTNFRTKYTLLKQKYKNLTRFDGKKYDDQAILKNFDECYKILDEIKKLINVKNKSSMIQNQFQLFYKHGTTIGSLTRKTKSDPTLNKITCLEDIANRLRKKIKSLQNSHHDISKVDAKNMLYEYVRGLIDGWYGHNHS